MTVLKFVKYIEKIKKNASWLLISYNNNVNKNAKKTQKI